MREWHPASIGDTSKPQQTRTPPSLRGKGVGGLGLEPKRKLRLEQGGRIVMSDYRLQLLVLVAETGSLAEAAQHSAVQAMHLRDLLPEPAAAEHSTPAPERV